MIIALLCPSKGRAPLFKRMVDSARATASNKENLRFYIGLAYQNEYEEQYIEHVNHMTLFPEGVPTVHKWNMLADQAKIDGATIFMLAADDMIFTTPCWDQAILEAYNKKPQVFALRDSRDENGTPHPIVTQEYIEAMGYFLPPIFLHWFIDTWTVEIAKANHCFTHLKDYMLVHDKPWDEGKPDETHIGIRKMGWLGTDRYTNEKCQHFLALEKSRLKMKLLHEEAT
jgi:hypothetical protein